MILANWIYFNRNEENIYVFYEDFLDFGTHKSTRIEDLAMLQMRKTFEINCSFLIERGADGAAPMKENFVDVQVVMER